MNTQIIRPPAFQRPSGKMTGPGQLNLANSVPTKMLLDTTPAEYTDNISDPVNHRILPGVAGFYHIVGAVLFYNTITDAIYCARLYVSGVEVCSDWRHAAVSNRNLNCQCDLPNQYLSATQYVELFAISWSGDNWVDIHNSWLAVQRVR